MSQNNTDKILEIMFEEAATNAAETIGKEMPEVTENINFSKEHISKMNKLFKAQRRKEMLIKLAKVSKIAASILLTIVLVGGISIFSVEAWRVKILNFIVDNNKHNTNIKFFDNDNEDKVVDVITEYSNEHVLLKYIPDGFEVNEEYISKTNSFIAFVNEDKFFNIDISNVDGEMSLDTEDSVVENVKIKDYNGMYISKGKVNMLVWSNDFKIIILTGNIQKNEIIKIAENIF